MLSVCNDLSQSHKKLEMYAVFRPSALQRPKGGAVKKIATLFTFLFLAAISEASLAQEQNEALQIYQSLNWQAGPGNYDVTSKANIDLPEGYDRLDAADTKTLMELYENPSSGDEYYIGPVDGRWFSVFSYEDTGHISDDEEIDPDDLLASLKEGTKASNEERRRRGWAELHIVGWQYEPSYSNVTNRLSWAVLGESEGEKVVNYNTRLLGKTGVTSATLVAAPEILESSVAEFEELLDQFRYNSGETYAEYREGDKLATYGLAALVTGGATAAVAKGAGKGLFKAIGVGIIAFFAFLWTGLKRIFSRKKRGDLPAD
jgi:uncharacterized membrane-anchored protein